MKDKTADIVQLVEQHFRNVNSQHVIDFGDDYSRLLSPKNISGTVIDHIFASIVDVLVATNIVQYRHINYYTFKKLFFHIQSHIAIPKIIETGSSAHGTNSSLLFASLVAFKGGYFDTVDISPETTESIKNKIYSIYGSNDFMNCYCMDSVDFLNNYSRKVNIVYLDSYDLNPQIFKESALHGLNEFKRVKNHLEDVAYILIDDTPCSIEIFRKMNSNDYLNAVDDYFNKNGCLPGKGELILKEIKDDPRFTVVDHEYQLLLKFENHNG